MACWFKRLYLLTYQECETSWGRNAHGANWQANWQRGEKYINPSIFADFLMVFFGRGGLLYTFNSWTLSHPFEPQKALGGYPLPWPAGKAYSSAPDPLAGFRGKSTGKEEKGKKVKRCERRLRKGEGTGGPLREIHEQNVLRYTLHWKHCRWKKERETKKYIFVRRQHLLGIRMRCA